MAIRETYAAAPPSTGAHALAERVWNSAPNSAILGWVCTTAGTPGIWTAFGASSGGGGGGAAGALPNVLDYGASATDAVSNAAQKAAFDAAWAASTSGYIYAPEGTYSFGTLRFGISATRKGMIGAGAGRTVIKYTSAGDSTWLFWTAGAETGGNKTLTTSLLRITGGAGDSYFPVLRATAHGFAANDWVKVGVPDNGVNNWLGTGPFGTRRWVNGVIGATRGEIVQVARTGDAAGANTGTAVVLTKNTSDNYTTGDAAFAVKIAMATDILWRDFTVQCVNPQVSSNNTSVFLFQQCESVRFENIDFYGVDEECIEGYNSVNVRVTNCHGKKLGANQTIGTYQGTLVLARCASQNWVVSGCSISNGGWHLFTTGGAAQPGVPRNILVADCWAEAGTTPLTADIGSAPFDTHAEGEHIYFNNCRVYGSARFAFNSRSPYTFFDNCACVGAHNRAYWLGRDGIWGNEANNCSAIGTLWTSATGATALYIEGNDTVIRNFTIKYCEGDGVQLSQYATPLDGVKLHNIVIKACDGTGVILGSGAGTISGCVIRGLDIENCATGLTKNASATLTACRVHDMTTRNVTTPTSGSPTTLLDCFNFTGGAWVAL